MERLTLRISDELAAELAAAAEAEGVSKARFVRETVLRRLAHDSYASDMEALGERVADLEARLRRVEKHIGTTRMPPG